MIKNLKNINYKNSIKHLVDSLDRETFIKGKAI